MTAPSRKRRPGRPTGRTRPLRRRPGALAQAVEVRPVSRRREQRGAPGPVGAVRRRRLDVHTDAAWAVLALGFLATILAYTVSFLVPLEHALPMWRLAAVLLTPSAAWLTLAGLGRYVRRR